MIRERAPRRMRVAAIGRTHWLYDAIEAVAARGHEIVLIGTAPASPEYLRDESDFVRLAERLGCPSFVSTRLEQSDVVAAITSARADYAISMNWPGMIRNATLGRFPRGVINAHPGDLPRYRGNACPNWAILEGDSSVAVTLHRMTDVLDAGPIVARRAIPIDDRTHIATIYEALGVAIPSLFAELADDMAAGIVEEVAQPSDPALALRCYPRHAADGHLDWSLSAVHLSRLVRASSSPFVGAFTYREDALLRVWDARATHDPVPSRGVPGQVTAIDRATGSVTVLCGDGLLEITQVSLDGEERVAPASLVRSTRERLGVSFPALVARLQQRVASLEVSRGQIR